jgi:chromosome segregation ATPase
MHHLADAQAQVAQKAQRLDEAQSRVTTLQGALNGALEQQEALRKESEQTQRELAAAQGALAEARRQTRDRARVRAEARLTSNEDGMPGPVSPTPSETSETPVLGSATPLLLLPHTAS